MTEQTAVPACTNIKEKTEEILVFEPSGIEASTEEFWTIWHELKTEHGDAVWQAEYTNTDKDYNAVQTRYLELHGMGTWSDPFADEDGFVDAVK